MSSWNSTLCKPFAASLQRLVCQFSQYRWILYIKCDCPLWTCNCNSSTPLPLQYGQRSFINSWTGQFDRIWLSLFISFHNVRFCHQVFPHWAGPMSWWMAKNMMTNYTIFSWAASILHSPVEIESPRRRMSGIIPSNCVLGAYTHRSQPSIKYDL